MTQTAVRKGARPRTNGTVSQAIPASKRFHLLEDEIQDEPIIILVGDCMIKTQNEEFCVRRNRRRIKCFSEARIGNIKRRIDDIIGTYSQVSVYVVHVGTNDAAQGRSEEIITKYKALIGKFRES